MSRFRLRPAVSTLAIALAFGPLGVLAQTAPLVAARPVDIRIAEQPLAQALDDLARQTRLELMVQHSLVAGKTAPAVSGRLTPQQAVERLLAGTGLSADVTGTILTIKPASPTSGQSAPATLAMVPVTAQYERSPITEQSESYTTTGITIGRMQQSLRETPQSVTVVTRQQMNDQVLTSVDQVMAQATGVTKSQRNFGSHQFAIRGFTVNDENYLLDGIPGMLYNIGGWVPVDTAIFDRVEILRGAAGMVVGAGDPSGAINLVRKRPRADKHFDVTATVGSWDRYRAEVDTGGPLNAEGTVRGRVVAAYDDRNYFYDVSHSRQPLFYGVIDADLGRDTTLTVGARRQENRINGYWLFGLPRYTDGSALNVSRSTSLAQDWNRHHATATEVFGELEHRFDRDWKARLTVNRTESSVEQKVGIARGAVNPVTGVGTRLFSTQFKDLDVTSTGLDANVGGSFTAFGGRHQVLIGATSVRQNYFNQTVSSALGSAVDINNPNPSAVPEPLSPAWTFQDRQNDRRYSLYASSRLQLAEPLHLLLGGRFNWIDFKSRDQISGNRTEFKESGEFTPYAGLVFDVNRQWSLYGSYADTFAPQSQYRTAAGSVLAPAVGSNIEAGVKGELYEGRLNVSAAVFHTKKNGVAVLDAANPDGCPSGGATSSCYLSGSTLRSRGFEVEATGEVLPGWQVAAGYTYVSSRDNAGETISAETPHHLLRVSTNYRLPGDLNDWTLGGGVSAQSRYSYFAADNTAVRMGTGGRAVFDLRASYRVNRQWTVGLNIGNLFDKTYYAMLGELRRGNYYGEPRSATLVVRGSF